MSVLCPRVGWSGLAGSGSGQVTQKPERLRTTLSGSYDEGRKEMKKEKKRWGSEGPWAFRCGWAGRAIPNMSLMKGSKPKLNASEGNN